MSAEAGVQDTPKTKFKGNQNGIQRHHKKIRKTEKESGPGHLRQKQ
jgi:hypothetical protein